MKFNHPPRVPPRVQARPRPMMFAAALMLCAAVGLSVSPLALAAQSSADAGGAAGGAHGGAAASAPGGRAAKLPKKILSGYTGFNLDHTPLKRTIRWILDPMAKAKFNAVDFKIHPGNLDLSPGSKQYKSLKALADAIHQRGMAFLVYVYPSPNGKRHPEKDAALPPFVDKHGNVREKQFSLVHYKVWRHMLDNMFELAKASRKVGIAALRVDLEAVHNYAASYDDGAWARFAKSHDVSADVPANQRLDALQKKNLEKTYKKWYFAQLTDIAHRIAQELHNINPDLSLGMMPAKLSKAFYRAFIVSMGTKRAPEIIDSWKMYGGHGFTRGVAEAQKKFKQVNPNLLFIPWFRVNRYQPDSITHQAYHAAMATDGYSSWTMKMLRPKAHRMSKKSYWLPADSTAADYFKAYREANEKVRAALAQGRTTGRGIAFKKVQPPPAPLYLESVKVPELQPAGSGEGEPPWLTLRGQQVIYLWARRGQSIRVDIRLPGKYSKMMQYALLDTQKKVLSRGTVRPGKTKALTGRAPHRGTYALVVTGGFGGGMWYHVRVRNRHMGLAMNPKAYLFHPNQKVWLARTKPDGDATVHIVGRPHHERFRAVLNKKSAKEGERVRLHLPHGEKISLLQLKKPHKKVTGRYTADFHINVNGPVEPLLFDGPQRRLTAAGEDDG